MFFNTLKKDKIQLVFDIYNTEKFNIITTNKNISFQLESVTELAFQKKINYISLVYFLVIEIMCNNLTLHYFVLPIPILFLLGIIRFLLFSDVFYTPVFEVKIEINTIKYTFHFYDEAVFVDFLLLQKMYNNKKTIFQCHNSLIN
jgi:hypothetical protein